MSMGSTLKRNGRERFALAIDFTNLESRTQQHFKKECDINAIMAKWKKSGTVSHIAQNPPKFGDFTGLAIDYQTANNMVIEAEAAFEALPSHIRERMNNDPQVFVDFMSDETNQPEAIRLGLMLDPNAPKLGSDAPAQPEPEGPGSQGATARESEASPPSPAIPESDPSERKRG